ncbi:hypothetical protein [Paraburkholderia sp. J67]|uniref:hypothetical protein n=1 Tax=Paraburkholderia sp. J67 TaxID=2805435 RepID=UPI002ABE787D|nr:hypothetical protein [Paraburkholderia sp. J67]
MSKDALLELFHDRSGTYSTFLRTALESSVSEKWGEGVGAPFSLEPYRMEILGIKPGRMLKKLSEPGKRRYHYFYNSDGKVIYARAYSEIGGPPEDRAWMHADDFYEYDADSAFRYVFGNAFRENPDSKLTRIVKVVYENGLPVREFQLESRNFEYTETNHSYDGSGNLIEIKIKWPDGPYPDRMLKIYHEIDGLKVFEIRDQREIPVYPES